MANKLDPETARLLALIQMQRAMGSEQPPVARPPVEQTPVTTNPNLVDPGFDPVAYYVDPYNYSARRKNPLLAALEIMVRPSGGYQMPMPNMRPSGGYQMPMPNMRPSGGYPMPTTNVRPSGGYPMPMPNMRPSGGR